MKKLYYKNRLNFTLIWIGIYIVTSILADQLSATIGIKKIITAPTCIVLVLIMSAFLVKNRLTEEYGFCSFKGKARAFLYFIPLIPLFGVTLLNGVTVNGTSLEVLLHIISMCCVGFMEELLFRGFLFRTMAKDSMKSAVIVSSITFGFGHIVNLLNGAAFIPTLLQLCYAASIGFMLVAFLCKGKSIWPCIIFHAAFNIMSIFAVEVTKTNHMIASAALCAVSLAYALWIWKASERK